MITPIEGPPINEFQTNLLEYRTTQIAPNTQEEFELKNNIERGLVRFNHFVENIDQENIKKQKIVIDYDKISKKLEEIINDKSLMIQFTQDDQTKKMIFKLINAETKEVVQQIPPEVALKIARYVASTLEDKNVTNAKV
ncbi:MAG: flagellar protein FlaG [Candidatus Kapaibacteriota bacterium]